MTGLSYTLPSSATVLHIPSILIELVQILLPSSSVLMISSLAVSFVAEPASYQPERTVVSLIDSPHDDA